MDRFKLNFERIVRSVDSKATFSLEGESIVIGVANQNLQQEVLSILPEEFENLAIVVIDLSQEDYES